MTQIFKSKTIWNNRNFCVL